MNIAAHLPRVAREHPRELAVVVQTAAKSKGRHVYQQYTLQELDAESNRLARALGGLGIGRGMRTVLMVKPSLEFFALTFALLRMGAVPVLVDPGIGIRNLGTCLGEARPEAFIGITKAHVARTLFGWARGTLRIHVTVGAKLGWKGATLQALRKSVSPGGAEIMVDPAPGETAAILFTSGSTGIPKGAVYTHEIFNAQVESLRRDYGIVPGERDLATFPLFALFGPALGMAAIIPDMDASKPGEADPRKIIAAIEDHQCTNMFGSPALLDVVGRYGAGVDAASPPRSGAAHSLRLNSLKRVISAGAPANIPSLQQFATLLPEGVEIFPSYGATEALPVAFIGSAELFTTAAKTESGAGVCVGRPIEGVEVRIIRITDDPIAQWHEDLMAAPGEIGEIVVRGAVATREYFARPESTALAKIVDPPSGTFFHRMGDLGYFDRMGRLWMCGRKSHRVETGTRIYFTIPCERIFNTHPQVRRTALVGVKGGTGTIPVLCVELEAGVYAADHEKIARELVALAETHPLTKDIATVLFHKKFPVDIRHNAKIFREKLALWAEKKLRSV